MKNKNSIIVNILRQCSETIADTNTDKSLQNKFFVKVYGFVLQRVHKYQKHIKPTIKIKHFPKLLKFLELFYIYYGFLSSLFNKVFLTRNNGKCNND